MPNGFENPFADYGGIVRGERFIGRSADLRAIETRTIHPSVPGNLAIVGDSRVGKSSLVYQAVMESKDLLQRNRKIPVWINLATCDTRAQFFRFLVSECYEEIEELGLLTEPIVTAIHRISCRDLSWTTEYRRIQRFFQTVKQEGFRVLFILDEFDSARNLFHEDINGFQGLRELSYNPQWRVTFITTSRRSVYDIEVQTKGISTLAGIFHTYYLKMYSVQDMQEFYERLASIGIEVTEELAGKFGSFCGGHPYLLDILGYKVVEQYREYDAFNLDDTIRCVEHEFLGYYDRMVDRLSEDGSFSRMLKILFGPVVDVKQRHIDELLRYGFVSESCNGDYMAFSDHFQSYLKLRERDVELWPIWRETELALRNAINKSLVEKYGEYWISELEKRHPRAKQIFQNCRESQKKEEKLFESRASRNLLDFTYPLDLFNIMFAEWSVFGSILKKDKNYWDQRAKLLSKVRNPLAHNRDEVLYEYDFQIAEGYCMEILATLKN